MEPKELYPVQVRILESRNVGDYLESCKVQFSKLKPRMPHDQLLVLDGMPNISWTKKIIHDVHAGICGFTRGRINHVCTVETFQECMTRFYNIVPSPTEYFSFIAVDESIVFTPAESLPFMSAILERWDASMDYSTSWKTYLTDIHQMISSHRQVTFGCEESVECVEVCLGQTEDLDCKKILDDIGKKIEDFTSEKLAAHAVPFLCVPAGIRSGDEVLIISPSGNNKKIAQNDEYPARVRMGTYDWSFDIVIPWYKKLDAATGTYTWALDINVLQPSLIKFLNNLPFTPMDFRVSCGLAVIEDFFDYVFDEKIRFKTYLNLDYLAAYCGVVHSDTSLSTMNMMLVGGALYRKEWIPSSNEDFALPLKDMPVPLALYLLGNSWGILNCYFTLKLCLLSQMFPTPGFMFRVSGLDPDEFISWFATMVDVATSNDCRKLLHGPLRKRDILSCRKMILSGKDIDGELEFEFVLRLRGHNLEFRELMKNSDWISSPSSTFGGPRCLERLVPTMVEMAELFCTPLPGEAKKAWNTMPEDRRLTLSWFGRPSTPECDGGEVCSAPVAGRCQNLPEMKEIGVLALSSYKALKSELDFSSGRSEMQILLEHAFYKPEYFKLFLDRLCLPKEDPLAIGFLEARKKNNLTKIVGYSLGIHPSAWERRVLVDTEQQPEPPKMSTSDGEMDLGLLDSTAESNSDVSVECVAIEDEDDCIMNLYASDDSELGLYSPGSGVE